MTALCSTELANGIWEHCILLPETLCWLDTLRGVRIKAHQPFSFYSYPSLGLEDVNLDSWLLHGTKGKNGSSWTKDYVIPEKISSQLYFPTSYNAREMIQMSAEWNCIVHRSMTHMSNTQDVKNNNTHNAQDHNISCNLTKTILQTKQSRWFSGGREVSNAWNQVSHTCALDRSANASSAQINQW